MRMSLLIAEIYMPFTDRPLICTCSATELYDGAQENPVVDDFNIFVWGGVIVFSGTGKISGLLGFVAQ